MLISGGNAAFKAAFPPEMCARNVSCEGVR